MHIEARLFEFLTAFFVLSAVVYAVLTAMFAHGGVEWAGVTALVMTSGLTLLTGSTPGPRTTRTPRSATEPVSWASTARTAGGRCSSRCRRRSRPSVWRCGFRG